MADDCDWENKQGAFRTQWAVFLDRRMTLDSRALGANTTAKFRISQKLSFGSFGVFRPFDFVYRMCLSSGHEKPSTIFAVVSYLGRAGS